MCHLIIVAVPGSDVDVKSHFHAYQLRAAESANPTVREALGTFGVYDVTDHGCSCSLHAPADAGVIDREALRRRYEKKGWGSAKIERAIESASRSRSHPAESPHARFVAALEALCRSGAAIRLLCHEYTGRFDEERFALQSPQRVSVQSLSQQELVDDAVLTVYS